MKRFLFLWIGIIFFAFDAQSQVDEHQYGGWYMYNWRVDFDKNPFGLAGSIQDRNWNIIGDMEQLFLQAGLTYKLEKANVKLTAGYYFIQSGEFGSGTNTSNQSVIYEDILLPQLVGSRIYLTHRFRYEQRFINNQNFRTRYRYNLFMNIPLNHQKIEAKTIYLAFSNEIFINGQKEIGNGKTVEFFDRNRFYTAVGYCFNNHIKIQIGTMRQTTNTVDKYQLQVSLYQKF